MATIRTLPGTSCRHYLKGRCLYEERLNPGYHREYRCRVIRQWEAEYDAFLGRAEAFRLEDGDAARMWEKQFAKLFASRPDCPHFTPTGGSCGSRGGCGGCRGGEELIPCARLVGDLCLQALPECPGLCSRAAPRREPGAKDGAPARGPSDT